ncbi:MAG: 3-isopropylmalate dehydratase small subunit [Burkholderiales bacterium]|nr:3-isopropylmalate dehydratase small subunit [Burkholderiales bacterium]MCW5603475.1 3-isopropylmalate dehydratase small subunit [Burkholderiales bacterium]
MESFVRLTAIAAPLDQPDIDTDMLIPQRFLRKPLTVGYRNFMFFNDRFDAEGKEKPDFILNREPYRSAKILVTGANFGCGSTREGAVYAVVDFGIRAIVASSFGAFYASNCYQNGLLPVVLLEETVAALRAQLHALPGVELTIDLPDQVVIDTKGRGHRFEIEPSRKERMLQGLDDIRITERYSGAMEEFESRLDAEMPWLSGKPLQALVRR